MVPPCFVVSTGRCGSKMLAKALARHPKIGAFHEPKPLLNTEAYLRWSGRKDSEYVLARLRLKRRSLIEQMRWNGLHYVESSHFMSHLIPELRDQYQARFVHLFRNGLDFVRSGLERPWYRSRGRLAWLRTLLRRATGKNIGISFIDHRLDPPSYLKSRFERITWLWVEINEVILKHLEELTDSDEKMGLRLEELGPDVFRRLLDFLGHDSNDRLISDLCNTAGRKPNQTARHHVPHPDEWSPKWKEQFSLLAGDMMERLGYSFE